MKIRVCSNGNRYKEKAKSIANKQNTLPKREISINSQTNIQKTKFKYTLSKNKKSYQKIKGA